MYKNISLSIIIILLMGVSFFGGIQYSELKAKNDETPIKKTSLSDEINALYNKNKTDLAKDVTQEKLSDLNNRFENEEDKDKASAQLLLDANYMFKFYEELEKIAVDEGVMEGVSPEEVEDLSLSLEKVENETFVKEKTALLTDLIGQIEEINILTKEVDLLFTKKGQVRPTINHEIYTDLNDRVSKLKNKDVQARLLAKLDEVKQNLEEKDALKKRKTDGDKEEKKESKAEAKEEEKEVKKVEVETESSESNEDVAVTDKQFKSAVEAVKWAKENMDAGENWSKKGFTSWKTKPIIKKDDKGNTVEKTYEVEFKK